MEVVKLVNGPLETNTYLLILGDWALVVDPASEEVSQEVKKRGLRVEAVINTHGHFDHIAGNAFLLPAPIYIHELDAEMLVSPEKNLSSTFFSSVISPPASQTLKEGGIFSFGPFKVEVIHTPGHTPGSVCLQIGDFLFTGDLLFKGTIGRTDLPGGDYEAMSESLRKIASLPEHLVVYPGHGDISTLKEEKENNPFLCAL